MKSPQDVMRHLEAGLRIDKDQLDEEVANLPGTFYSVSDYYLEALRQSKRLQERLDRRQASLASAIRSAAQEEGGSRAITETQIKQEIMIHPSYRKLKSKLTQAVYVQDRWSALKDAYTQKSFSLKGLVSLAVSEQFQSPHSTRRKD